MKTNALISQIGPLLMLAAGLGFAIGAALWLDLGSLRRMGPGAFPLLVGGILALLSLICLLQNVRRPLETKKPDPLAVIGICAAVAIFAFLSPRFGVLPATAIAVFAAGSVIPGFAWPYRLLLSLIVSGGVWLIFVQGLGMPLIAIRWP